MEVMTSNERSKTAQHRFRNFIKSTLCRSRLNVNDRNLLCEILTDFYRGYNRPDHNVDVRFFEEVQSLCNAFLKEKEERGFRLALSYSAFMQEVLSIDNSCVDVMKITDKYRVEIENCLKKKRY